MALFIVLFFNEILNTGVVGGEPWIHRCEKNQAEEVSCLI